MKSTALIIEAVPDIAFYAVNTFVFVTAALELGRKLPKSYIPFSSLNPPLQYHLLSLMGVLLYIPIMTAEVALYFSAPASLTRIWLGFVDNLLFSIDLTLFVAAGSYRFCRIHASSNTKIFRIIRLCLSITVVLAIASNIANLYCCISGDSYQDDLILSIYQA